MFAFEIATTFFQLRLRASSKAYAYRPFVSLELVQFLGWAFGPGASAQDLVNWWEQTCAAVRRYPLKLLRRYATLGWPQDVEIPLVEPTNLPAGTTLGEVLRRLVQASPSTQQHAIRRGSSHESLHRHAPFGA